MQPPMPSPAENEEDLKSLDWLQTFDLNTSLQQTVPPPLPHESSPASSKLNANPCSPSASTVPQPSTNTSNSKRKIIKLSFKNAEPDEEKILDENRNDVFRHISGGSSVETEEKTRKRWSADTNTACQCTFSCLIYRAIEDSTQKALPLQGIYDWILTKYPDFTETRSSNWQRSLRHSLSLNTSFVRFPNLKGPNFGSRGSWWTVHPDYRRAYGAVVMRQGPQHRCLPRAGHSSRWPPPVHLPSSEKELESLEEDIKAAATMVLLKRPKREAKSPDSVCVVSNSGGSSETTPTSSPSKRKRPSILAKTTSPYYYFDTRARNDMKVNKDGKVIEQSKMGITTAVKEEDDEVDVVSIDS